MHFFVLAYFFFHLVREEKRLIWSMGVSPHPIMVENPAVTHKIALVRQYVANITIVSQSFHQRFHFDILCNIWGKPRGGSTYYTATCISTIQQNSPRHTHPHCTIYNPTIVNQDPHTPISHDDGVVRYGDRYGQTRHKCSLFCYQNELSK